MSEKLYPENTGPSSELANDNDNADQTERDTFSSTLDQIVELVKELTPLLKHQEHNGFLFMRMRDYEVPDSEATVTLKQFGLFYPKSPNAQKMWEEQLKNDLGLAEISIYDPRTYEGWRADYLQTTYTLHESDDGRKVLTRTKPTPKEDVDLRLIEFPSENEAAKLLELLCVLRGVHT